MIFDFIPLIIVLIVSAYKLGHYRGSRCNYVRECKLEDAAYTQGYKRGRHHLLFYSAKIRNHTSNQYVN